MLNRALASLKSMLQQVVLGAGWMKLFRIAIAFLLVIPVVCTGSAAEIPDAIAVKGETVVLQVHAAGAQIYECKADANGRTTWQFREPIASLFLDGKTVGRHYAGPSWEVQGSTIFGRAVGKTPGASAKDIPWLKLEVTDRHGEGPLKGVDTVQRINTEGGNLEGACDKAADLRAEPYAANYIFLRRAPQ
jgi:hypothetical protein